MFTQISKINLNSLKAQVSGSYIKLIMKCTITCQCSENYNQINKPLIGNFLHIQHTNSMFPVVTLTKYWNTGTNCNLLTVLRSILPFYIPQTMKIRKRVLAWNRQGERLKWFWKYSEKEHRKSRKAGDILPAKTKFL